MKSPRRPNSHAPPHLLNIPRQRTFVMVQRCLLLFSGTNITDIRFVMPDDLEFIELDDKEKFLKESGVEKKDKREFSWTLA